MYCGMVATEANSPAATSLVWLKFILWLLQPLFRLIMISPSTSGENMTYGLLKGDRGFTQRNYNADSVGPRNVNYSEKEKELFWEHCLQITGSESH
jgi:hypothetical protein